MSDAEGKDPKAPLLIKRYSSRRLYNTENSQYVSLRDIAAIIRSGRDVQIVDQKTGEDLTRHYFVQIIAEQESNGVQLLPLSILSDMVRSYSHTMAIPDYVDTYYKAVREGQERMLNHMMEFSLPVGALKEFQDYQDRYFQKVCEAWRPDVKESEAEFDNPPDQDAESTDSGEIINELDTIRRKLSELEAKLAKDS